MSDLGIPIIDLSGLENASNEYEFLTTVKSIAEASRDWGFFYVKNHGVSEAVRNNLFDVTKKFFALPLDQKEEIKSKGTGGFVGYFKFQSETTGYLVGGEPDWREGLYVMGDELPPDHPCKNKFPIVSKKNLWPKQLVEFKQIVEEYHVELMQLALKIMHALAQSAGIPEDFFDSEFVPYSSTTIGMYHYPPCKNIEKSHEISCGEHTDYGILTILMQDDVGGLEVKSEDGRWIPAPPVPDTFVINLGDMLEVWTNNSYKATLHRVRKVENDTGRLSVAYFLDPKLESIINPIKENHPLITFKKRTMNKNIKLPVIFGDYLQKKYKGTFVSHYD